MLIESDARRPVGVVFLSGGIESDAINVFNAVWQPSSRALKASIIEDVWEVMSQASSESVCYIPRNGNSVTRRLANFACMQSQNFILVDFLPDFIGSFVLADIAIE